uniref:Sodium channel blocker AbNaTx5 n=1 Tax=Androctonus bicolor TaxID=748906 RepID=A0A0K0LBW1_9SCOR|nr:sodium channel blocker AbNaTx5 [Androctonus bicolor]
MNLLLLLIISASILNVFNIVGLATSDGSVKGTNGCEISWLTNYRYCANNSICRPFGGYSGDDFKWGMACWCKLLAK